MQNKTLTIYWGILWIFFSTTAFAQLPEPRIIYNDGRKSNAGDNEKTSIPHRKNDLINPDGDIGLHENSSGCNTYVYYATIKAGLGEKILLGGAAPLTDNSVLIATAIEKLDKKYHSQLIHLSPDGSIKKQSSIIINGLSTRVMNMMKRRNNQIVVSGILEEEETNGFVAIFDLNFTLQSLYTWNAGAAINNLLMDGLHENGISIAVETSDQTTVLFFNPSLALQWSSIFAHNLNQKIKGIFYSTTNAIILGRTQINTIGIGGYEILEINAANGSISSAWQHPTQGPDNDIGYLSGFSNVTGFTGLSRKNDGSFRVYSKRVNVPSQSFADRYYAFDEQLDEKTDAILSRSLDAIAIYNATKGKLYYIFQSTLNNNSPEYARSFEVPVNASLRNFLKTTDAGYLFALEDMTGKELTLIKSDSSGIIPPCNTDLVPVQYERVNGTQHKNTNINFSPKNTIVQPGTVSIENINLTLEVRCKSNYCPPIPLEDTCSAGFMKILESSFLGGGVYSGFIKGDTLFTYGALIENYSSGEQISMGALGKYDQKGNFVKGAVVYTDDVSAQPMLWPGGIDTLIMHTVVRRNDSLLHTFSALDKNFNLLWSTTLLNFFRIDFLNFSPVITDMARDAEGNLYFTSAQSNLSVQYMNVGAIKFNHKGEMIWNRQYRLSNRFLGMLKATITPAGLVLLAECTNPGSFTVLLDKATGAILDSHHLPNNTGNSVTSEPSYLFKYMNGKIFYVGSLSRENSYGFLAAQFDERGKPLKLMDIGPSAGRISASVHDGYIDILTGFYNIQTFREQSVKIRLDSDLNILHAGINTPERYFTSTGLMHNASGSPFAIGFAYHFDPGESTNLWAKFTPDGQLGSCKYIPLNMLTREVPITDLAVNLQLSNFEYRNHQPLKVELVNNIYGLRVAELLCKSDINCTSIQVEGPDKICNIDATYSIQATLNNTCGLEPLWQYDTTAIRILSQDDKSINVQFKKAGNFAIKASLFTGCSLLEDSIKIIVAPQNPTLELGTDTTLCPGDSIQLNAGAGYSTYQWNTGATDSTIWISKAGKYFVTVDNTCGEPLSDTIEISMSIVPPLSSGPDASVCTGTTFQRLASDGFATYQWKNLPTQSVVSNSRLLEQVLTNNAGFALAATNADGCSRYDTLSIQVLSARNFSLGPNQNICTGDTTTFTAPENYASYLWNTGATTYSINAWQPGQYILAVTDTNGCSTADTVLIATVFALPQPALGPDKQLCAGSTMLLNPGNFTRYQWHDGSTQSNFNASTNGTYFVQVWDANNCTAADTLRITALLPVPADFLNTTDSLCQYEKLTLQTEDTFLSYLWSNGSTQPTLLVERPGSYALRVTDQNNCTGTDTVHVIQKTCMEGVYIPSAFTPNNDAVNDIFRPLVFGVVIRYEFSVYNRYGERMYTTNETIKGWDGTWKGKAMPANTYAWMCSYELQGGEAKVERGMVTLIR
jgi:gliding motility-associated-like protein